MDEPQPCGSLRLTITLGVDGRLYCQDLPPQFLPVVKALCPNDPELLARGCTVFAEPGTRK